MGKAAAARKLASAAAYGGGGLSVLGETLFAQAGASGASGGACEIALGKSAATASAGAAPAKSDAPSNPVEGIGNALKGLFQR